MRNRTIMRNRTPWHLITAAIITLAMGATGIGITPSALADGTETAAGAGATRTSAAGAGLENLGRGLVAVRTGEDSALLTWRYLAADPHGIAFNVYRDGVKVNAAPVTGGTDYTDTGVDLTKDVAYAVKPVVDGVELAEQYGRATGRTFTLKAGNAVEPAVRVHLTDANGKPAISGDPIKYVWPADLDGDGEYDYIIDRQPGSDNGVEASSAKVEAYRSDGTFLWRIDMGPMSTLPMRTGAVRERPGSTVIDSGSMDGVTAYDFDGDGKAEVAIRIADGVTYPDGKGGTIEYAKYGDLRPYDLNDPKGEIAKQRGQSLAVFDGMTGTLKADIAVPALHPESGPLVARLAVGHVAADGHASIIATYKNRPTKGDFNLTEAAYDYTGGTAGTGRLTQRWVWDRGSTIASDGHQTRIIDVDQDGRDEVCEIGFCLTPDGKMRHSFTASDNIRHGDRWYITDLDPSRPGLEGYGIQQGTDDGMREYVYDPAYSNDDCTVFADQSHSTKCAILWRMPDPWAGKPMDEGRGSAADVDPTSPGAEVWAFSGIRSAATGKVLAPPVTGSDGKTKQPIYPEMTLYWDGDLGKEILTRYLISKYNPQTKNAPRITQLNKFNMEDGVKTGVTGAVTRDTNPLFYGDMLGDWREEAIYQTAACNELVIFTTNIPTDIRVRALAQNRAYRNSTTMKGYMQDHELDYYLGFDNKLDQYGEPVKAWTPNKPSQPVECASSFKDVSSTTPHSADIAWLACEKIAKGYDDGTYGGMNAVVRQDMAAFLYRLAGSPAFDADKALAEKPFTDVTKSTPHYREILWLHSVGIAKGYRNADGSYSFGGMRTVVRQDMAAFLKNLADAQGVSPSLGEGVDFTDVDGATPHAEEIAWLAQAGVATGWELPDGSRQFRGMNVVVRQDMAAFLHRMSAFIG